MFLWAKNILTELIAFPSVSSDSNLAMIEYIADYLDGLNIKVEVFKNETASKAIIFATIGHVCDGGKHGQRPCCRPYRTK